ncbi:hypothetical protein GWK08_04620 [Leptobacterium flavescens]|uniref:Lipocalin-like domain-containing protein n=1 Tax=Leptobacterium flavescens TaxID=472055 RepID=A0A6P0UP67_9FLAO|nr:lipocalin family protein [Leptobacterium flavescens]NER12713.1 hypothetical protein [Leptobacterium flavescens]
MKPKLFFILLCALVYSCTFDDSEDIAQDTNTNNSLVGFWDLTSLIYSEPVDANFDGTSSDDFLDEVPCFNVVLEFMENGSYVSRTTDVEFDVDPVSGEGSVDCLEEMTESGGTWTLDGTTLSLTSEGQTVVVEISLQENVLSFEGDVNGLEDLEIDEDVTAGLVFVRINI